MMTNTRSLQDEKVKSLAKKYSDQGFDILIKPKIDQLPFDLDNYQPDILATKNNNESGLMIDVKTSTARVSIDRLQSVAEEVSKHPGWRFLLVTLEDIEGESLPGTAEELPSWEEITDYLRQVNKLIENHQIEPAFLFLWSIFEGALRKRAIDVSIPVERLPAIRLIKSMYSLGELSISEFDTIQTYLEKRNRLTHGYIQKLNWEVLLAFVNLVCDLLEEWVSEIYTSQKTKIIGVIRQIIATMTKRIEKHTAQTHQTLLESVAPLLHNETRAKKDKILAKIKQVFEEEGLQHLVSEYYDLAAESNHHQLNENKLVLRYKAQIPIDALPKND